MKPRVPDLANRTRHAHTVRWRIYNLVERGAITLDAIETIIGISRSKARASLHWLKKGNLVKQDTDNRFSVV